VTTYTPAGQPDTIDPPGHGTDDVTSFTSPARGFLLAATRADPIVGTTTYGYDPFNRRTSVTDPNGLVTKTSYDEFDRVTEVRQEGANPPVDDLMATYRYTPFRDLFQIELPRGNLIE
jgi:YD repeat-containing protein